MGTKHIPLGKLSKGVLIPQTVEQLLLSTGQGWLGKAFSPGVCFCGFVLLRFLWLCPDFCSISGGISNIPENLFTFSECREAPAKLQSPQDSDMSEEGGYRIDSRMVGQCQE